MVWYAGRLGQDRKMAKNDCEGGFFAGVKINIAYLPASQLSCTVVLVPHRPTSNGDDERAPH